MVKHLHFVPYGKTFTFKSLINYIEIMLII